MPQVQRCATESSASYLETMTQQADFRGWGGKEDWELEADSSIKEMWP